MESAPMKKKLTALLLVLAMAFTLVACGTGALEILKLIPEGSREMRAADFIRGLNHPGVIAKVLDGPPPPPPKP